MSDGNKSTFGSGIVTGLAFGIGATLAAGGLRLLWHAMTKKDDDEDSDEDDNVLDEE